MRGIPCFFGKTYHSRENRSIDAAMALAFAYCAAIPGARNMARRHERRPTGYSPT
jgi:hypothetical protein